MVFADSGRTDVLAAAGIIGTLFDFAASQPLEPAAALSQGLPEIET
jgi:hypothetical protein